MNSLIFSSLEKLPVKNDVLKILPHQLATIDYIYKKILNDNESVLLFHKMGSGKTIISLIVAVLLSKQKKINIVLPNVNIKNIWISKIAVIKQLLPFNNYNFNINFMTKKTLIDILKTDIDNKINMVRKYKNILYIIDEAHTFFGNLGSKYLLLLNSFFEKEEKIIKPLYILVTGSPITNTLVTLKDLVSIMSDPINENDYMEYNGKKIFNYNITEKGQELIKNKIYDKVSYYNQEKIDIPSIIFKGRNIINLPFIFCQMSQEQTDNYYEIKKKINNEMFLKYLLDLSFTSMGNITNINYFENYIKEKKKYKFTETLSLNKGEFQGEELTTLNNSCKIKFFINRKLYSNQKNCKTFIYFSNSRIGGRFLKDVLKTHGIQEYGKKELNNFKCFFCGEKRTCKKCKPIKYIIITSIYLTNNNQDIIEEEDEENELEIKKENNINNLLDIFNSKNNDNGEEIMFLFGSKIISESYTLKETREIWFLTIPDSVSEINQIIARCLRNFSYADNSIPVYIYILAAITNDFDIKKYLNDHSNNNSIYLTQPSDNKDKIKYYTKMLEQENNFSYDFKKILYIEIKSTQTNKIHSIFKNLSIKKKEKIHDDLISLYVIEILKRYVYENTNFKIEDIKNIIHDNLFDKEMVKDIIQTFIKDNVIIYNKYFKQCNLIEHEGCYYVYPILLSYKPFLYKIEL